MVRIIIADTGSSTDEINKLKEFIKKYNNIELIEFNSYNFAKINNEVVKNYTNKNHEFLLFSNNDIKILNDILTGMLEIFKQNPRTGTVGCRLHFDDNTIQHEGIFISKNRTRYFVGHLNYKNYYNYYNSVKEVIGNTAGLMMVRKNVFEKNGLFNENYLTCFEDVEFNIKLIYNGLKNFVCGECVAYHYESQTRNNDTEKNEKEFHDFQKLTNSIDNYWEKIKEKITII